jgi:SNF2 family DNA or RNA helicase
MAANFLEYQLLHDKEKVILFLSCIALKTHYYSNSYVLQDLYNESVSSKFKLPKITSSEIDTHLKKLKSKRFIDSNLYIDLTLRHAVLKYGFASNPSIFDYKAMSKAKYANPMLIALYLNDHESFKPYSNDIDSNYYQRLRLEQTIDKIPFDAAWLESRHINIRIPVLGAIISCGNIEDPTHLAQAITMLKAIGQSDTHGKYLREALFRFAFAQGNLEQMEKLCQADNFTFKAVCAFLRGDNELALAGFAAATKIMRKEYGKRNIYLPSIFGLLQTLAMFKATDPVSQKELDTILVGYDRMLTNMDKEFNDAYKQKTIAVYFTGDYQDAMTDLTQLKDFMDVKIKAEKIAIECLDDILYLDDVFNDIITLLVALWAGRWHKGLEQQVNKLISICGDHFPGYAEILRSIKNKAQKLPNHLSCFGLDFTTIASPKPQWDMTMAGLEAALGIYTEVKENPINRLVWIITTGKYSPSIEPYEQKFGKSSWSSGRLVSIGKLRTNSGDYDYITAHDRKVLNCIETTWGNHYSLATTRALVALIDHPLLFDSMRNHIELTQVKPELIVKESGNEYNISLSHPALTEEVTVIKENTYKYKVLQIDKDYVNIARIIEKGITVPKEAKDRVLSLVQKNLPSININASIDVSDLPQIDADSNVIVQLVPIDSGEDGLKIDALVRPWGEKTTPYPPDLGPKSNIMQTDDGFKNVMRNFALEKQKMALLHDACPSLKANKESVWKIGSLEDSLEALYELQNFQLSENSEGITIEWPKGKAFSISRNLSFENLKMNIRQDHQWFEFDGSIEVDQDQVLSMRQLLQLINQSNGRFIKLDNDRFVALTDSFLKRLKELQVISSDSGDAHKIHPLASQILLEFAEKAKALEVDKAWQKHLSDLKKAKKHEPKLPTSLKAELRTYQLEGFNFLSRLGSMKLGACLADDMGLGKTVQTIALLLEIVESKQDNFPSLVIAPASVCHVWELELEKFAPSLKAHRLDNINREETINKLGNEDILICSYSILNQVEELVTAKEWKIIILDEAQAIKNFYTKRFKIVSKLKSKNRVALSGTPVENHIEELWNLFEFLNPGFLGSRESFHEKYAKPIQQDKNKLVSGALRQLIQPFILRRLKSKVLEELPDKIEQTILVEPSEEEKNFYEALRAESVEKINQLAQDGGGGKTAFSVLTELTKLRRACCDTSLVTKDHMPIVTRNSKLDTFEAIVSGLIENNHRALVFSQYVDYLAIVRKRLDDKNISYQYLDGSTPQKKRQEAVANFQGGQGDLFLISLKAGGVGLNLTAADYVIHLDPWWNPAVEDQASDRAHRIGQNKVVTVYRLVMQHSIEEKIIKLHGVKRDLAVSLLSDTDKSASFTSEELLQLLLK